MKNFILYFVAVVFGTTSSFAQVADLYGGPIGIERVAMSVGTPIPYISEQKEDNPPVRWLTIDVGSVRTVDSVKLYPYFQDYGRGGVTTHNFPRRFYIETAENADFKDAVRIADCSANDYVAEVPCKIETFRLSEPLKTRYVRLTVTSHETFELWRFEVFSDGKDIAETGLLSDFYNHTPRKHELLRERRYAGETVWFDHPEQVTQPDTWHPVKASLQTPRNGVVVGGLFRKVFEKNIDYLLNSFTVNDMAHNFLERAGRPCHYDHDPGDNWFVSSELGGSVAGRFLMGAGNTLRWEEHSELRRRMDALVDSIAVCAHEDGFIYGYPENMALYSHNNAYSRGWITQGLIEAGIAGNDKVWSLLRRGGDWFNSCPYLPEMMFRVPIGIQGMVANSRTYLNTPIGKPADIQVLQRYFQLTPWLTDMAAHNPDAIWKYPYERVHSYLIVTMNAYMDMYMATGDKRYFDAMKSGWDMFHDYWEQTGGCISLIESYSFPPMQFPPGSNLLRISTGELCGNVFWTVFNQQFRVLYPEEEKYAAEMEKSIYNVGIANQDAHGDIRYTPRLIDRKGGSSHTATCCEGQGCRLYGSLPEYIFKTTPDGIYVDLYNEASIQWEQDGKQLSLSLISDFPLKPDVKIVLKLKEHIHSKIRIRVPSWAAAEMAVAVNGKRTAVGKAGSYLTLDRQWNNGDEITFSLPMSFRVTKYTGADPEFAGKETYAIEYGPILMAVTGDEVAKGLVTIPISAKDFTTLLKPVANKPLHYAIQGTNLTVMPYYEIDKEPFTCFPFM